MVETQGGSSMRSWSVVQEVSLGECAPVLTSGWMGADGFRWMETMEVGEEDHNGNWWAPCRTASSLCTS